MPGNVAVAAAMVSNRDPFQARQIGLNYLLLLPRCISEEDPAFLDDHRGVNVFFSIWERGTAKDFRNKAHQGCTCPYSENSVSSYAATGLDSIQHTCKNNNTAHTPHKPHEAHTDADQTHHKHNNHTRIRLPARNVITGSDRGTGSSIAEPPSLPSSIMPSPTCAAMSPMSPTSPPMPATTPST